MVHFQSSQTVSFPEGNTFFGNSRVRFLRLHPQRRNVVVPRRGRIHPHLVAKMLIQDIQGMPGVAWLY